MPNLFEKQFHSKKGATVTLKEEVKQSYVYADFRTLVLAKNTSAPAPAPAPAPKTMSFRLRRNPRSILIKHPLSKYPN